MLLSRTDIQTLFKADNFHDRVATILCVIIASTLPFFIQINSVFILLLGLNWVIAGKWKSKFSQLKASPYAILWIGFMALNAISLFYSSNVKEGNFEIEKKLSLIAFPLIFFTSSFITANTLKLVLRFFILSCFIAASVCLTNALFYLSGGDSSYLFYHQLSSPLGFHAVYFSMYIGFCLICLLFNISSVWNNYSNVKKFIYVFLIVFFFIFLVLLSSKMLIVSTVAILIAKITYGFIKNKLKLLLLITTSVIILGMIISKVPYVSDRFQEIFKENYKEVLERNDYQNFHFTGGTIRLAIWKSVIDILNEQNAWLLGVGIGDAQDLLTANYNLKHIYPGDAVLGFKGFTHYNAHNQYLQFLISLGIVGLLCFLIILIYIFRIAIKSNNSLLMGLLLLFCSFCLTESVLSSHKGVVFFLFFASLLVKVSSNKKLN